ncbi:hypothetical protein BT67DRAFT_78424 [Trichocladium antarcticum]|uniref:Uncharacterized protein n=1 Tax=Trichocladium antarcticum TaxID=1450529 RepID=A0AAN6ZBS4_9PEZI|nr:hypothetical protein BT67DRAFT_78424 [Trichocladium antarcticum]
MAAITNRRSTCGSPWGGTEYVCWHRNPRWDGLAPVSRRWQVLQVGGASATTGRHKRHDGRRQTADGRWHGAAAVDLQSGICAAG